VQAIREWAAQCYGVNTGLPHSSSAVPGMAARGGLAEQRRDMILRRCERAGVVRIRF
jgi:hypothetical protein